MNLIPLVSSNLWAARIRPRFPSLMRSESETPWFWYFLATETTKRRLLRTSLSSASASPSRIRWARRTSSSWGIRGYLLISRRYWSSEPSSVDAEPLFEEDPTCSGFIYGKHPQSSWDWEVGAGDWGSSPTPNPQLPCPNE